MKQMRNGMKNLDKLAYAIICNWPKEINFNPVFDGIDYSQILRFYLWDKVGRAIRIKNNTSFNEVDSYREDCQEYPFYYTPFMSKGKFKRNFFSRKKIIFIPFQTSHTSKLIQKLQESNKYRVLSKQITKQLGSANVISALNFNYNEELSGVLFNAVIEGLKQLNINLIAEDVELLKIQVEGAVKITALAEKELLKYRPDALYVHSDNHPPFINYVLVAKKLNIPSFMYQHGLDCEHYYLDDCYADSVAVWSNNRKKRYQNDSFFQPKNYTVIGNALIHNHTIVNDKNKNNTIVFLTRPHKSIKCYSPTRNCVEGFQILNVILDFLSKNLNVNLILKLHPMDYKQEYEGLINKRGLENRAIVSIENLHVVLQNASVVVTEDSTAGAEAMYYGKPCIHAHFANSEPVLPFVKYGCAFPGFTQEELMSSLTKALSVNDVEMNKIKVNQKFFLNDFIPIGDIDNLVKYITANIK